MLVSHLDFLCCAVARQFKQRLDSWRRFGLSNDLVELWAICNGLAIKICSFPSGGQFAVLDFASLGIVIADSNAGSKASVPVGEAVQCCITPLFPETSEPPLGP